MDANQQPTSGTPAGPLAPVERIPTRYPLDTPLGGPVADAPEAPAALRVLSPRLLRRYKFTILLGFLAVALPGMAAAWTLFEPQYSAEALLEVRSLVPRLIHETEETGPVPRYEEYRLSQVEIMRSPAVLSRVLDRPDVQQTAWYKEPPSVLSQVLGQRPQPLTRLQSVIQANPLRRTELIRISASTRAATDAKVLVDAVLDEYIIFSRERLSDEDRRILEEVLETKESLETEIAFAQRMVSQARRDLGTGSPEQLITQRRVRLDEIEADLHDVALELAVSRERLSDLEARLAEQDDGDGRQLAVYHDDGEWRRLNENVADIEQRIEVVSERFGPQSDPLRQLNEELATAQRLRAAREAHLDALVARGWPASAAGASSATGLGELRAEVQQLEIRQRLLRAQHEQLQAEFDRDFSAAESLRSHAEELASNKAALQKVETRLTELREKGRVPATIRTISRAALPTEPSRDRRIKLSALVLVAGLFSGLSLAALRVRFNPRVQEVDEVHRSVGGPFLGVMPLTTRSRAQAAQATHTEAARVVRTALLNRLANEGPSVMQITSASMGSGKSTLALLLARSLAQCGRRVLLVDGDFHRSTLADRMDVPAEPGLPELIRNPELEPIVVRETDVPRLWFVPSAISRAAQDSELLGGQTFVEQLERWRQTYDLVLIDGPPLLASADATVLARVADGVVLVVREEHCRVNGVMDAMRLLASAGGRLLGTVFVGSSQAGGYAYGYGYGHGVTRNGNGIHVEGEEVAAGRG